MQYSYKNGFSCIEKWLPNPLPPSIHNQKSINQKQKNNPARTMNHEPKQKHNETRNTKTRAKHQCFIAFIHGPGILNHEH